MVLTFPKTIKLSTDFVMISRLFHLHDHVYFFGFIWLCMKMQISSVSVIVVTLWMLECFRHVLRVELKFFLIYTHFMNCVLTLISVVNWELLSICTLENYLLGWIDDIHTEIRINCHLSTENVSLLQGFFVPLYFSNTLLFMLQWDCKTSGC
jgi:hypothetical protein